MKRRSSTSGRAIPLVRSLVIIAFGCACSSVGAQTDDSRLLTLEDAVRQVVEWHPAVTEAVGRLNAREQQIAVAEAGYLPQIEGGIGTGYNNIGGARWRPRANLSASQMIFDFGKVSSTVALAEAGTKVGRAQLLYAVDSLVRDTSYAIIEIQRSRALQSVVFEQLERIRSISGLVDQRFQKGAATRSDALQAQARIQAGEAILQQIEAEQRRWVSNLVHLLGVEVAPAVSTEVPPWLERSCERGEPDWARVPALMQVQAQRDEAEAELDRNRANALPTVSLGAGTSTDINDPFSRRAEYNFGINVSSSLYSGGANSARIRGANYALEAADAAEANIRNEVSRLLSEAQRQIGSFNDLVVTLTGRERSMSQTGELYRLQYFEMGTRTLVDLLNAEQELQQVRLDLVNTRHDLRRLNVDCLFNAGEEREAFRLTGLVVEGVRL